MLKTLPWGSGHCGTEAFPLPTGMEGVALQMKYCGKGQVQLLAPMPGCRGLGMPPQGITRGLESPAARR